VEIIYDSLMGGWCYIPQDLWTDRDFFFLINNVNSLIKRRGAQL
jgi:hypothetical protein